MKRFLRSKRVLTLAAIVMIAAAVVISLSGSITHSHAQGTVTITEFPIPTRNSGPGSITAGPDGNLWFTQFNADTIGKLTLNGTITEYNIPTRNSGPDGITAGPDGNLWFTEELAGKIGKITPTGTITDFNIPFGSGGFPAAPGGNPISITAGPDGNLWFTVYSGLIGNVTPDGTFTGYLTPTSNSDLIGITTGPDGNLWFTETGGNVAGKIGKITTNGTITEYPVPTSNGTPYFITTGPDGNLWFTESNAGKIGNITTDGTITEYNTPSIYSYPQGITSGPDGNLWSTEDGGIANITTDGTITEYPTPTRNSGPFYITSGPDGNVWFTEGHANNIGRVNLSIAVRQITASPNPVQINQTVTGSANFTDILVTTHTATWDWGDGTTSTGTVTEPNGSTPGTVGPDSHTYTAAGVYPITLTVTTKNGEEGSQTFQYLSVYDPTSQGLFSAAEKYTSPAGAYRANTSLTGTVLFGLSYKYSGTIPVGNRPFSMDFNQANFHFNATSVNTLVISNGIGTLTGTGTLNGSGTYNFLVTGSERANTIRIQITDSSGYVVYDTQPGAAATATPTTSVKGHVLAH